MARSSSLSCSASLTTARTIASMSRGTSDSRMSPVMVRIVPIVSLLLSPGTAYPIAFRVEKQGGQHLDVYFVADGQVGIGLYQGHEVGAVGHPDVQAALVAQVLDPADLAQGGALLPLADAHVLGAHADSRRLLRSRHLGEERARDQVHRRAPQPG